MGGCLGDQCVRRKAMGSGDGPWTVVPHFEFRQLVETRHREPTPSTSALRPLRPFPANAVAPESGRHAGKALSVRAPAERPFINIESPQQL
jgi:hypothetical protein